VVALVALPFAAAGLVPFVYRLVGERTAYYAAAVALLCFALVGSQYGTVGTVSVPWIPALGVSLSFYVDGLALLIGFLASGVGVLIFAYSASYMHGESGQPRYYAALLAFMGSMLGVAFAADLVALFVFWELTSVSSYVLIGFYTGERDSRYAARKSMLITVGGGLFMLVGFVVLHAVTGTFSIPAMLADPASVRTALSGDGLLVPVILLLGVGAAAKSAQVPLHIWLPDAMEAPTPVSAFLHSATMVKAGVYLVGRFRPLLLTQDWTFVFATMGLVTMTVAAVLAVQSTDIKELLAYSTASHLGLIIAGFGFAEFLGAETGSFHILNHATFKAPLFLVAGILAHEAGTRKLADLGGLRRELPITAAVTVVAGLSMAGVPPFSGFYSKELLFETTYEAAVHAGGWTWVAPVVAVLGSVFTFLYSIRFVMLFFGDRPAGLGEVHRPPLTMLLPPIVLALVVAFVSVFPQQAVNVVVQSVVDSTAVHTEAMHVGLPTTLTPSLAMSAITIASGIVLYQVYDRLHDGIRAGLRAAPPLRADWWYDGAVFGLNRSGRTVAATVQTGLIRTYATWVLAGFSGLALGGYAATSVSLPATVTQGLTVPVVLVLVVAVVAAAAVSLAPSHIAGVLTLSILGFMVAIFYILASAPDLALTQLVVETLTLVIFLLVLDRLPAYYGESDGGRAIRDGALALVVGGVVTVTVLLATSSSPPPDLFSLAPATIARLALEQGGGHNVVNVILVDLRGFDTMGEISVIGMAALSVLTLIGMRERGETQ